MTEAKLAANRANSQLSTGPVTEQGKANVSRNATRHGLSASRVVIAGESEHEYHLFSESFLSQFAPQGDLELDLVREITAARWRLRRVETLEAELLNHEMRRLSQQEDTPARSGSLLAEAFCNLTGSKGALSQLHRHEGRLRRAYEKALRELRLLQSLRSEEEAQPAPQPTVARVQNKAIALPEPGPFLEACLKYSSLYLPTSVKTYVAGRAA